MTRLFGTAILTVLVAITVEASSQNNGRGAKAIGVANAFTSLADDAWALVYNPAGLGRLKHASASAFFVPQQFGIKELRTVAIAASVPFEFGTIGVSVEQFGFELFRETGLAFGIGKKINWEVHGGITVHIDRLFIDRYGSATRASIDVGLFAQAMESLSLGFMGKNVTATTIGVHRERLPQVIALGGTYTPVSSFLLGIEIEKDIRYPASIKVGFQQKFLGLFSLRAGIATNPDKYSGGLGLQYSIFEFGYAGYSHNDLGWTHQIEVTFRLSD